MAIYRMLSTDTVHVRRLVYGPGVTFAVEGADERDRLLREGVAELVGGDMPEPDPEVFEDDD